MAKRVNSLSNFEASRKALIVISNACKGFEEFYY